MNKKGVEPLTIIGTLIIAVLVLGTIMFIMFREDSGLLIKAGDSVNTTLGVLVDIGEKLNVSFIGVEVGEEAAKRDLVRDVPDLKNLPKTLDAIAKIKNAINIAENAYQPKCTVRFVEPELDDGARIEFEDSGELILYVYHNNKFIHIETLSETFKPCVVTESSYVYNWGLFLETDPEFGIDIVSESLHKEGNNLKGYRFAKDVDPEYTYQTSLKFEDFKIAHGKESYELEDNDRLFSIYKAGDNSFCFMSKQSDAGVGIGGKKLYSAVISGKLSPYYSPPICIKNSEISEPAKKVLEEGEAALKIINDYYAGYDEKEKAVNSILKDSTKVEAILRIKGANEIRRKFFKVVSKEEARDYSQEKIEAFTNLYWDSYGNVLEKIGYKDKAEYLQFCNEWVLNNNLNFPCLIPVHSDIKKDSLQCSLVPDFAKDALTKLKKAIQGGLRSQKRECAIFYDNFNLAPNHELNEKYKINIQKMQDGYYISITEGSYLCLSEKLDLPDNMYYSPCVIHEIITSKGPRLELEDITSARVQINEARKKGGLTRASNWISERFGGESQSSWILKKEPLLFRDKLHPININDGDSTSNYLYKFDNHKICFVAFDHIEIAVDVAHAAKLFSDRRCSLK